MLVKTNCLVILSSVMDKLLKPLIYYNYILRSINITQVSMIKLTGHRAAVASLIELINFIPN